MTRKAVQERQDAIDQLREWIKPGDTVYTILESVSRSGMSRTIRVVLPYVDGQRPCDCHSYPPEAPHVIGAPKVDFIHPNYSIALAIGARRAKRGDGIIMGGCGMDMGFHLVYELSSVLYGGRDCVCYSWYLNGVKATADEYRNREAGGRVSDGWRWLPDPGCTECKGSGVEPGSGYRCLGKGKCPSNYHVNHRDRVRCDGVGSGDDRQPCYAPSAWGRYEIPADWPRRPITVPAIPCTCQPCAVCHGDRVICDTCGMCTRCHDHTPGCEGCPARDAITLEGPPLACIGDQDAGTLQVCPTCDGAGDVPNPAGPERFDLLHTDGYALRHRWL